MGTWAQVGDFEHRCSAICLPADLKGAAFITLDDEPHDAQSYPNHRIGS